MMHKKRLMAIIKTIGIFLILLAILIVISIILNNQLDAYLYSSTYTMSYSVIDFLGKIFTAWFVFTFMTQYVKFAKELEISRRYIYYILCGVALIVVILHFDQFYYLLPLDYSICWDVNEVLAFVAAAQIAIGILCWKGKTIEL